MFVSAPDRDSDLSRGVAIGSILQTGENSPETGVIDRDHRVFGYDGLYVIDGSAVSANPGVNPSLTIAAFAERAMSKIPRKDAAKAAT